MKKHLYKAALVAALGLAGTMAAQAQYTTSGGPYANNDLDLGFTSPDAASVGGTSYDYVIDLGQLLGQAAGQISLSSSYSDSTFTTDLGAAATEGGLYAGIFGAKSGSSGDVLMSATSTPTSRSKASYDTATTYPIGVTLGAVAQGSSSSVYSSISEAPGVAGAGSESFESYLAPGPLETVSAAVGSGTGTETLNVYEATYTLSGTTTAWANEGYVSILFGSNGSIDGLAWDETATAPTPAPEPATYGIFGGIGVLLLTLRRQLTGKLA